MNLPIPKTGKVRAIRFSTLDAIYHVLDCQPGDILRVERAEESDEVETAEPSGGGGS